MSEEIAKVIIVTEQRGEHVTERRIIAPRWEELDDGRLHVFNSDAVRIATYQRHGWLSVRLDGTSANDPYFTQGKKLAIALDALREIADEPHVGFSPERAAKALDDIADVDL